MYNPINDLIAQQGKKAARSKKKPRSSCSLRKTILDLASEVNSNLPVERHVSNKAVITVAERSLTRTAKLEKQTRIFAAYRDVASFVLFAASGHVVGAPANTDLLPIGHPYATRKHRMSEFALRETRARWIAADPRIDNSMREIVAAAYSYPLGSAEQVHAHNRISAVVSSLVPRDIVLDAATQALIAVGIGGNSSAARSARARLQRRDRNGQFAYQGGGIQFFLKGLKGNFTSVVGKFVGNSLNSDEFIIEVKKDPVLKDGLYKIPAVKSEAVKAIIPSTGGPAKNVDLPSNVEAVDLADLTPLDAPDGWEVSSVEKQDGKGPDKVFKSGDGYIVEVYNADNPDKKSGVQTAWKYNTPFGSSLSDPPSVKSADGKTGPQAKLDKDEPVYILYRDKTDATNKKSVAIAQDWADIQEFAAADEKNFDKDYADAQAKNEKIAKSQEESKKKIAELDKQKADTQNANAQTRAELESLALEGKDINGNDVPDGWEIVRNDSALYPASEYDSIDKNKAFAYTKNEQNVNMTVYHDENGNLVFDGKPVESWDAVEAAVPDYVKGKIQETREKAKEVVKPYDDNGDIAAMIDSNATPEQVLEELAKDPMWDAAMKDLETSWAVDLPTKAQKEKWAGLQRSINVINSMKPAYEKKKTPEVKAVIDKKVEPVEVPTPEVTDVSKTTVDVKDFIVPDGAYKLQLPSFEPEGRIDQDSKDYTDDPKVLANKFTTPELTDALAQALTGKTDFATEFIDELDQLVDDTEEDTGKKKKTGPKPKKPEKPKAAATGYGSLNFSQGEEFVPAEAIYQALEEQGVDPKMATAQLYDLMMGENKNVDMIIKGSTEEVKAQAPSVLLDELDMDVKDLIQLNEGLAQPDDAAIATAIITDYAENGDPNPNFKVMADDLKTISGPDGFARALDKYIEWGLGDDVEKKQAFRGMFALMLSGDGGYAAPNEDSEFKTAVAKAVEKYNGSPSPEQVDALFNEMGYYTNFLASKKRIVSGEEGIEDPNSTAAAFYRLVAQMSTPTDIELYRGIQLDANSDALANMIEQGSIISVDPRSFSIDKALAGKFAGALGNSPAKDKVSVIFTVPKGEGDSVNITSLSPFPDEQEHLAWGNYRIAEVREKTLPTGRVLYNVKLEKISKRDAVLEGYSDEYKEMLTTNDAVDLPEGYYNLDTDPYSPMTEKDPSLPEEFDDSPLTIARMWDKNDLIEVFRGGIEDGSGKANLEYPIDDGYEASVPVEAIRDALQIQGVDTNQIINDVANASPDAEPSTDEPSVAESNVEDPITELANDVGSQYDMEGWKQVGPQLGSNKGGFYEDAEGNRYYVKEPKSDLHAQNEALASALYRALGVDAAEIYMGSGEDGKLKTYSPDIENSKQDLQEKLKDPAYLAKLQEGFAVDAWLGNWDVAGLVFDNVMSDGDGNPVRVDPGGALLFRAQGAPKGKLFGNDANELDSLRDPKMNPQSASIFGSMTEEQQKASAAKLLDISHDDIDTLVDTIIEDPNVANNLKDTLKARRQFILDRYNLLGEDTSLIAETTDVADQAPDVQEKKAADSVESRFETLYDWADSYSGADGAYTENKDDQKKFEEIANQVDAALVDYRNGDITDESMPQVIDELKNFIETYSWSDEKSNSNADDLVDQLNLVKSNFYPVKPEDVTPPAPEVPSESVNNPYVTSDGVPIEPGMKLKHKKTGEVVDFVKYDKGNSSYVYVKLPDGTTKVKSTKQLESVTSTPSEVQAPTPELPTVETPVETPAAPETPSMDNYKKVDTEAQLLKPGYLLPTYYPTAGGQKNLLSKRDKDPNYEMPPADEVTKVANMAGNPKKLVVTVRELKTGKERKFGINKNAKLYDVRMPQKPQEPPTGGDGGTPPKAPTGEGPDAGTANVDKSPTTVDTTGTIDDVAKQVQTAIEGKKNLTFNYNGKERLVTPLSVWVNPKNGNVNMYAIDLKDGEKKKNFTLQYVESLSGDGDKPEVVPSSELKNIPAPVEEKPAQLQLHAQMVKDVLAKNGTNISDEKAIEIRDAIDENDAIDGWSEATEQDIYSAIQDVVSPGIVDIEEDTTPAEPEEPKVPVAPPGEMKISDVNGNDVFKGIEVTDKKGNKGTVLKVNKDNYALVEFEDGSKGWRSANTISTTGNVNSVALAKAYKPSKTKVTPAGTTAIVVDNPSDWDVSDFENVPSLLDAIELVQTPDSKSAPMRGASAAVDSDSIEDLDVRIMKVRDAEGKDSLLLKFKLTSWAGNAKAKELLKIPNGEEAAKLGINRSTLKIDRLDIGEDGVGQVNATKQVWGSDGGYTWTITTEDGIVIKINRANRDATSKTSSGKYSSGGRAFHNLVTITAPAGATPEQIAKALKIAGVQDTRPATQADARILVENRLMSVLDAKTDATKNLSGDERAESLARIEKKYGITPDDVVITTGASGRLETRLKPEAAQKIVDATGKPEALQHNLNVGVSTYDKTQEQADEARAEWIANLLSTPQGGLLSTTTRWTEGIGTNGMSSSADVGTGGADYVFTRPVKTADAKVFGANGVVLYFDPNKVYQRLDFYANYHDAFGKRQSSQDVISAAKVGAYEVMFKQRLGWEDLDVMVVPNAAIKTAVIAKLRQRGVDQLGGKPLEQAITIGSKKEATNG